MFNVVIKIKVDPTANFPFQALVKIDVENQGFQERLMQYSENRNVRIDCKIRSSFIKVLVGQDMVVQLVEDSSKNLDCGYLENYILNGFVFGFSKEDEVEEFKEIATNLLENFLSTLEKEYIKVTQSKYNLN